MILLVIFLMSFFCIGMYLAMQPKQIFSFMREPILKSMKGIKNDYELAREKEQKIRQDRISEINKKASEQDWSAAQIKSKFDIVNEKHAKEVDFLNEMEKEQMRIFYFFKPLVICVWCFASFWGAIAFIIIHHYHLHDMSTELIPLMIFSCVCTIFLNAIFEGILHKLDLI